MADELEQLYLEFTFDLVARRPLEHLHWGLWRDVERHPGALPLAQRRYAEAFVAALPPGTERVLDVGCGLGGIAARVAASGRAVTAITPRRDHAEALREAAVEGVEVRCTTFEAMEVARFDALLFAESLRFFVSDAGAWRRRCDAMLRPGGVVLAADLLDSAARSSLCGEWSVERCEDWTDEVAPTLEALEDRFESAQAYGRLLEGVLRRTDPALADAVARRLEHTPNRALRELFAGRMVERAMLDGHRYELLLLRKPGGQPQQ